MIEFEFPPLCKHAISLQLELIAADQTLTKSIESLSYGIPNITTLSQTKGNTSGFYSITIYGRNLGASQEEKCKDGKGKPIVKLVTTDGDNTCNVTQFTHNSIEITVPPGTGKNKFVEVEVINRKNTETTR